MIPTIKVLVCTHTSTGGPVAVVRFGRSMVQPVGWEWWEWWEWAWEWEWEWWKLKGEAEDRRELRGVVVHVVETTCTRAICCFK